MLFPVQGLDRAKVAWRAVARRLQPLQSAGSLVGVLWLLVGIGYMFDRRRWLPAYHEFFAAAIIMAAGTFLALRFPSVRRHAESIRVFFSGVIVLVLTLYPLAPTDQFWAAVAGSLFGPVLATWFAHRAVVSDQLAAAREATREAEWRHREVMQAMTSLAQRRRVAGWRRRRP